MWSYTAGGRIDSPPTIHKTTAIFGCADGRVYCVRLADGELAWRFLAAPEDRRVVSYGQLESAWPVPGSVLVRGEEVWAVAGRASYLDGGMHLVRLDAATGKCLARTHIDSRDPKTGYQPKGITRGTNIPGVLPDIPSGDGESVFLRHARFDAKGAPQGPVVDHLFSPAGFLEWRWWHRNYWLVGTRMGTNYGGWPRAAAHAPAGRLLVVNGKKVYGFGRDLYIHHGSHIGLDGAAVFHFRGNNPRWTCYRLFAVDRGAAPARRDAKAKTPAKRRGRGRPKAPAKQQIWAKRVPLFVRAMVLADKTLFVAGPPNPLAAEQAHELGAGKEKLRRLRKLDAALHSETPAALWAVSAADGEKLAEYELDAPPAWDGMAAAGGKLYLTTTDGKVVCMQGAE